MELLINNQPKKIQEQLTVLQLLQQEIPGRHQGIAIAINNRVIHKTQWEHTHLADKDQVTIIRATQGG